MLNHKNKIPIDKMNIFKAYSTTAIEYDKRFKRNYVKLI